MCEKEFVVYLIENGFEVVTSFPETFCEIDLTSKFKGMMPKSISSCGLSSASKYTFMFAEKLDGVRCLIYVFDDGIYVQTRDGTYYWLKVETGYYGTCLDCEFINGEFVVFDLPWLKGKWVGSFMLRYAAMRRWVPQMKFLPFSVQSFKNITLMEETDNEGFILIEMKGEYSFFGGSSVYKWKKKPTIDVKVSKGIVSSSDGIEIGERDVPDGVYEVDMTGEVVSVRDKEPNSLFVMCMAYSESLITYAMMHKSLYDDVVWKRPSVDDAKEFICDMFKRGDGPLAEKRQELQEVEVKGQEDLYKYQLERVLSVADVQESAVKFFDESYTRFKPSKSYRKIVGRDPFTFDIDATLRSMKIVDKLKKNERMINCSGFGIVYPSMSTTRSYRIVNEKYGKSNRYSPYKKKIK